MIPLTPSEKNKILSRIFWDVDTEPVNAEALIEKNLKSIEKIHSQQFFRRLLISCDWYTLLKLIGTEKLANILTDPVIDGIFPRDLKTKYEYARDILYR